MAMLYSQRVVRGLFLGESINVKKADIGVGIGLIIISTWIFWYASEYSKATIYYYGPNFFPQISGHCHEYLCNYPYPERSQG